MRPRRWESTRSVEHPDQRVVAVNVGAALELEPRQALRLGQSVRLLCEELGQRTAVESALLVEAREPLQEPGLPRRFLGVAEPLREPPVCKDELRARLRFSRLAVERERVLEPALRFAHARELSFRLRRARKGPERGLRRLLGELGLPVARTYSSASWVSPQAVSSVRGRPAWTAWRIREIAPGRSPCKKRRCAARL